MRPVETVDEGTQGFTIERMEAAKNGIATAVLQGVPRPHKVLLIVPLKTHCRFQGQLCGVGDQMEEWNTDGLD